MKKSLSLLAMLTVLVVGVLATAACGLKPKTNPVWEVTKIGGVDYTSDAVKYFWCFHSDGNIYQKYQVKGGTAVTTKIGSYKIKSQDKMTINSVDISYTLKKDVLTLKFAGSDYTMKKTTQKEFK